MFFMTEFCLNPAESKTNEDTGHIYLTFDSRLS